MSRRIKSVLLVITYIVVVVIVCSIVASYGVRFICDLQHFTQ